MKRFGFLLLVVAFCLGSVALAGDVRPLYDGTGVTNTLLGKWTLGQVQSITNQNGEVIINDTDAEVTTIFDDDAAVLGLERTESTVNGGSVAAGDEFRREWAANNDQTQMVTISRMVVDFTDETDTTEDGTAELWVMAAGTLTKIATIDASGITIVGDVSGTTIGGITEANLVDKSATETIAGTWTFSTAPSLVAAADGVVTNLAAETILITNGVIVGGTALH